MSESQSRGWRALCARRHRDDEPQGREERQGATLASGHASKEPVGCRRYDPGRWAMQTATFQECVTFFLSVAIILFLRVQ
jgi:hypothetical protein